MSRFISCLGIVCSLVAFGDSARAAPPLTAAALPNGALQVWATASNGQILTAWQSGTGWSAWVDFSESAGARGGTYALAAAPLSDGRLEVWGIDSLDRLITTWKVDASAGAQWGPGVDMAESLGRLPAQFHEIATAPLADGRIELWTTDTSGALYTTWKIDTASDAAWNPWYDFSQAAGSIPGGAQHIAGAPLSDGRVELWAVDNFGRLYTSWKIDTSSTSQWTTWSDFFALIGSLSNPVVAITVAPLSDGRLELWALDNNGHIYTAWKTTTQADGAWSDWLDFSSAALNTPRIAAINAARMGDGRVAVFGSDGVNVFETEKQTSASNSGWTAWQNLNLPHFACDGCQDGACLCNFDSNRCAAHGGIDPSFSCTRE